MDTLLRQPRQILPGPRQASATSLEAVRNFCGEAVFSRDTAERIAAPQALPIKWFIFFLGVVDGKQILSLSLFP